MVWILKRLLLNEKLPSFCQIFLQNVIIIQTFYSTHGTTHMFRLCCDKQPWSDDSRRWKQNTKKSYRALLAWGEIWHYLASVCSASFEANSAQVESLLLLPPLILHYEARSSWEKNLSKKLNHFSEVNSTSPTRPCITKIHCGLFRKYFFRRNQIVMSFLDSF